MVVYAIGNKGREILERKGYTVKESYPEVIEEPTYAEAMLLSDKLLTSFAAGEIGEIYLAYTLQEHGEPRAEAVEASARGI